MPVIGMAPAMLSTGGFVCAICADLVLGVPAAVEAPILSKYFGKWIFLTWQTNVLCLLYSLLCAADAQYPSPTLDAWVVGLFPLYFMVAFFLSVGYYGIVHSTKAADYPYIEFAAHAMHGHATVLALGMCCALRVAPTYTHVVSSTWPFLIEYLCLTCVNKKLTKEWMYFFLDDAERTGMYPKK